MFRVSAVPELTEIELIARCRSSDRTDRRQAQRLLYERYKRAMYTTAFRILNDADHAHDALQDAFVEVFRNLTSFRSESSIGRWIKTIVIRQALRKQRLESRFLPLDETSHDQPLQVPDTLTGQQLDAAIRALPAGARAVFLLIEVEGFSHKEVAELTQISEGTSKSQLHYAKKLLRRSLAELQPD